MHARDIVERLGNAYPARQDGDVRDETNIAHEPVSFRPGVAPKHSQFALEVRQTQNRVECGRFAGAIRPDQSKDAALLDSQVDAVERYGRVESLPKSVCFYAGHDQRFSFVFFDRAGCAAASSSAWVIPSRSMVVAIRGHSSPRNFSRSPFNKSSRAPALTNIPRPRFVSTSCSSTSC